MQLHAVVCDNPGILKSHVERFVPYAPSTVHYHIGVLIREGTIKVYEPGAKKKHLFDYQVDPAEYAIIAALNSGLSDSLIKTLQTAGEAQLFQLAERLPESRKIVKNQLTTLEGSGVVEKEGEKRAVYRVTRRFEEFLRRKEPMG